MVRAEDGGPQPGTLRRAESGRCELCLRIGSALLLVPLAIGSAYLGGPAFLAIWALAAAITLWEWSALVGEPGRMPLLAVGTAAFAVAMLPLLVPSGPFNIAPVDIPIAVVISTPRCHYLFGGTPGMDSLDVIGNKE